MNSRKSNIKNKVSLFEGTPIYLGFIFYPISNYIAWFYMSDIFIETLIVTSLLTYVLSYFLFTYLYFYENYFEIYFPLRWIRNRKMIHYSEVALGRYPWGRWNSFMIKYRIENGKTRKTEFSISMEDGELLAEFLRKKGIEVY